MAPIIITRRRLGGSWRGVKVALLVLVTLPFVINSSLLGALLFAWIPVAFIVVVAFGSEEVELDLEAKRYRSYFSFFGSRAGAYKPLPDLDHLLIRAYYTRQYAARVGSYRSDTTTVELSLVARTGGRLVLRWAEYTADVLPLAQQLSQRLGLRVVDTSGE